MSDNCSSSPIGGCTEGQTLTQLKSLTDIFNAKMTEIISKKQEIIIDINDCNDANKEKLENIIANYQHLIDNDCCDEIMENLQRIIDLLSSMVYEDYTPPPVTTSQPLPPVTTEEPSPPPVTTQEPQEPPVTTEEPSVPPSTTEEPQEPPATTEPPDNTGLFYVGSVSMLLCIEDELFETTLYYNGTFGTGAIMYTDFVGGTRLTGHQYIKEEGNDSVYNLNIDTGVVGSVAYSCEA